MEQIGYSLIKDGKEIQFWGDQTGFCPGAPDPLRLPNGDNVHCASLNEDYSGFKLVRRMLSDSPPSKWHSQTGKVIEFDGADIIVTATYAEKPDIVPAVITKLQLRNALIAIGLWSIVKAAIEKNPDSAEVWALASDVSRASPLTNQIALVLGKTPEDVDNIFRAALS